MAVVRKRTWESKAGTQTAWLVDYHDASGKRRFETFKLRKDAAARLTDIQGELKQGTHVPQRDSVTVAEAADIWYRHCEARGLERATLRNYERHLRLYLTPMLGRIKLAQLTTPRIAAFRDELLKKTTAARTRKLLGTLKAVLNEAQTRGLVAQNVALPVKLGQKLRDKRKLEVGIDIPSKAEIRLLLDAATAGRWRAFFTTLVFTGLRTSEARGLTWDAIDFDKRVLSVRQRADRWGTIGFPKSEAGRRQVGGSKNRWPLGLIADSVRLGTGDWRWLDNLDFSMATSG
jgi:integrase